MSTRKGYTRIAIYTQTFQLCALMQLEHFVIKKQYRFIVWGPCMRNVYRLFRLVVRAGNRKDNKLPILEEINDTLDQLKGFVRLAHLQKVISDEKYFELQAIMQEIGRMLGGWLNKLRPDNGKKP